MTSDPKPVSAEEMARVMRWRTRDDLVQRKAGIERLAEVVQAAAEGNRPVRPAVSIHNVVHDILADAWKGLDRTQHPDDFDRYAEIIGDLAWLWLDAEEADGVYLDRR